MRVLLAIGLFLIGCPAAFSQDASEGFLPAFVEQQLSSEGRQVRLRGVSGLLSSKAFVQEITVADTQGIWLRISDAQIDWQRSDLFSGALTINSLTAETIQVLRRPLVDVDLPNIEARAWVIPELPITVDIGGLRIARLEFGVGVFGLASVVSAEGSMNLAGGSLEATLDMLRLDGPGGQARLAVKYQKVADLFDIGLAIDEPEQGVIANVLNIVGQPSLRLSLEGHGPVGSLDLAYALQTDGLDRVGGHVFLRRNEDGLAFNADFSGELQDLVWPKYRALFQSSVNGELVGLRSATDWRVESFALAGAGLKLNVAGVLDGGAFRGEFGVESEDLSRFSGVLGRQLAGSGKFTLTGIVMPLAGGFDLELNGNAVDLAPGIDVATRLLRGETRLSGRIARDENGLRADGLTLRSRRGSAVLDGLISSTGSDLVARLELVDLADLGGPVSGEASAKIEVSGVDIVANVALPDAVIARRSVTGLALVLEGALISGGIDGRMGATAVIAGVAGSLKALVVGNGDELRMSAMDVGYAGVVASGDLAVRADGLMAGKVGLKAGELAAISKVLGFALDGQGLAAEVVARHANGRQRFEISARAANVAQGAVTASNVVVVGSIADPFGVAKYAVNLTSGKVAAGELVFGDLAVRLDNEAGVPAFDFAAGKSDAVSVTAVGQIVELAGGAEIQLHSVRIFGALPEVSLQSPASIILARGRIEVAPLVLQSGDGTLQTSGTFGDVLAAKVAATAFPINAMSIVLPSFGFAGTISGTAQVFGTRVAPEVAFDLTAGSVRATKFARFGIPVVDLVAKGNFVNNIAQVDFAAVKGAGFAVTAKGEVPLNGNGVDVSLSVDEFSLALLDKVAGNQGLTGKVVGSALVTGQVSNPEIAYFLSGTGISAAALRSGGISAFTGDTVGRYRAGILTLGATALRGQNGLGMQASGSASVTGGPVSLQVTGTLPLALADGFLAGRGAQADGIARVSAQVGGTFAAPNVQGNVSFENGTITDPATNIRLNRIAMEARFDGQTLLIKGASARSSAGGGLQVSGHFGFAGWRLNPDLRVDLKNLAYADGRTIVTRLNGKLTLSGALLAGDIALGETQIVIPEGSISGRGGDLLDVQHRGQSAAVQRTLERVAANAPQTSDGVGSRLRVDVNVSAPGRIFVRGRGLDTELRGTLGITGTLDDVVPVGAFEMVRGRFAILGQRFDFRKGQVTLEGNLDPILNFRAETQSGDVTVFVDVSGSASDPAVTFSSSPELPQDEVIGLLIFDRGLADLSAFQLVQLASAVRELNGGRDNGLFSRIRNATGLDDLDIQTDADGSALVTAGKYVEENIYLELEAGSKGNTRATINLDLSDHVTAKASAGTDGDSGVGVFYERDY